MSNRKRFLQVGLGGRSRMFMNAICETHAEHNVLVGLCDINPGRLKLAQKYVKEHGGGDVPGCGPDGFEAMIAETKPDTVIVTTKDSAHDHYIVRAMELGCHAITEKPMTVDEQRCRRILDTADRTGKQVRVTFNYRYSPPRSQVKELLMQGAIGKVLSVDFNWLLNLSHGADYFRRWHRNKENSGGLLVHKATHHFDLVNWWLSSLPEAVSAFGHRGFYVPEQAEAYGLSKRGERCTDCPEKDACKFNLKLENKLKDLYADQEHHDGYLRDRCVFSEDIDIEDALNVIVRYRSGATMSYSLNAFMPWEGYRVTFNGTKGRLIHSCQESSYVNGDGTIPGETKVEGTFIRLEPNHAEESRTIPLRKAKGGHGGGDQPLLDDLFAPHPTPDPLLRAADQRAGAASILVGVAANKAIAEERMIKISELVPDLKNPDWPTMPTARIPAELPASCFEEAVCV